MKISIRILNDLVSTLRKLNWHYGRGEIFQVDIHTMTLTRKIYWAGPRCDPIIEKRKFRFDGRTVFAFGHRRKLGS